ncbi:nucleoside/nucleotide kinase family protein [Streptomyces sp. NBC_00344]|uniref:nucleoside/nucleotide kinase family protein n=1 Tax=Streptomyces sp. NBC_00344 TaxID=2975720 RepID=UPI002E243D22
MSLNANNPLPEPATPGLAPLYRQPSLDSLTRRALNLAEDGRVLIGLVGEPGAGKSTLSAQLCDRAEALLPARTVAVSMDGFHLAQRVIDARHQSTRKGTIDTFDGVGFLAMLARTLRETETTVWWPEFRREIEEPVAGAVEVAPHHRLVIVDGNFLLADQEPWHRVREHFTEIWFLDAEPQARRERLTRRYIAHGFAAADAHAKAGGVDEDTSAAIRRTASLADLTLTEGR